jgi:hypothetical protein
MDPTSPEFETTTGKKVFMDISRTPTLIVTRSELNGEVYTYKNKKTGIAVVRESRHSTKMCTCSDLCIMNNFETKLFYYICIPKEVEQFKDDMDEVGDRVEELLNASGRFLNHSLVFYGDISKLNTSLPRLLRRPSLCQVVRAEPKWFTPWGSEVDFRARPELLRPIVIQIRRGESEAFLKYMEKDNGKPADDKDEWHRFWPLELQRKSTDVLLTGKEISVDEILNNSIFVSPFTGPHVCSYCGTTVTGTGIESLLDHLVRHHRKLRDSVFSCPVCISTVVVSWEAFPRHFARTHEASTGLLVVLNQIQTHVRTAWGLALVAFIKVVNTLDISLELGQEPDQVVTTFGGYTPIGDGQVKLLIREVKKRQEHFLQSFLRTQREAEASGMRTPGMVSRSASPQRGASSLGKRKMSQRVPSPRPMGSGQARDTTFSMEVENVDICTELTRCINSMGSAPLGRSSDETIAGFYEGGQDGSEGGDSEGEQDVGDADETMDHSSYN